jgi:hypothetical protein
MKNSNDTIGNRTRDLPVCSAVPQPTVPPWQVPGVNLLGHEADHSLPFRVKVKNAWSYSSSLAYSFMTWCLFKHRHNFTVVEHDVSESVSYTWLIGHGSFGGGRNEM